MRPPAITSFIAVLFVMSGCANDPLKPGGVAYDTIDRTGRSGVESERMLAIRDNSGWSRLWAEHTKGAKPARPLPAADFSSQIVIGVFSGARPNGCYAVSVDRVYRQGKGIVVEFSEQRPGPGMVCAAVITYPSHIVKVQSSGEEVRFVKRDAATIR